MELNEDKGKSFPHYRALFVFPLLFLLFALLTGGPTLAQPVPGQTITVKTGSFLLLPDSQAVLNIVDTKNIGPDSRVTLLFRDDQNRAVARTTGVIGRGRTLSLSVAYEDLVPPSGPESWRTYSVRGIAFIHSVGDSKSDNYIVGVQIANTSNGWLTAGASCPVKGPLDPGSEDEPVADCGPCHVTRTPSDIK